MPSTNERRLAALVSQVGQAENLRGEVEPIWREYVKMYSNRERNVPTSASDTYRINSAFASVEVLLAAGGTEPPVVAVTPRKKESVFTALVAENVLEYWFDRFRVPAEYTAARRDSCIFGRGWVKTVWNSNSQRNDRHPQVSPEEVAFVRAKRDEVQPLIGRELPDDAAIIAYLQERLAQKKIGEPSVRRISPWDMLMDPQAVHPRDARWIEHSYWVPILDVKKNKMFSGTARGKVEVMGWDSMDRMWHDQVLGTQTAMDLGRVRLRELWDAERHQLIIRPHGMDDTVLYDEEWPYIAGDPFTTLEGFPIPDSCWPAGAIELISPQIGGMNRVRQRMEEARDRTGEKWLIPKGLMTDEIKELLESGEAGDGATYDPDAGDVKDIFRLDPVQVNPEWYRDDDHYQRDLELVLGISDINRGLPMQGTHRTVAEVSAMQTFGQARIAPWIQAQQWAITDIARKMISLGAQFMTSPDVVTLRGAAKTMEEVTQLQEAMTQQGAFAHGDNVQYPFDRTSIDGHFDFKLEVGQDERIRKAMDMWAMLANNPTINQPKLAEHLLTQGFQITDPSQFIAPPPPPPPVAPGDAGGIVPAVPAIPG